MPNPADKLILGSRSPRRLELLSLLLPRDRIEVRAPSDPSEAGFDDLTEVAQIEQRLAEIARAKNVDVATQPACSDSAILTADTTIVGLGEDGRPAVLGQPPEDDSWKDVVRDWFERYYLGVWHTALTAICLRTPDGRLHEALSRTEIRFRSDGRDWLDWYIATGEPRGKAGGYGLQGAADIFVQQIIGSPSNVVGLPLRETAALLQRWDASPRLRTIR